MSPPEASALPAIEYIGHAGFVVNHESATVLVDPWFYPAFLQSWFPLPDNRAQLSRLRNGSFDYLYVSHSHEDHFDEKALSLLDRDIAVLVPAFRSHSLQRKFKAMGFRNVRPLEHRESTQLGRGFTATMLLDTSHKEDSGMLFDLDGFRFLDLNDCNTPLTELPASVDLLAAQFSGAMWYPNCYDYPDHIMRKKVESVVDGLLDTLIRKVELTGARSYMPCAGPACFLDPALEAMNDPETTIFPRWEHVAERFSAALPNVQIVRAFPGDIISVGHDGSPSVESGSDEPDDLLAYRARRHDEWKDFYDSDVQPVDEQELRAYFDRLAATNRPLLEGFEKTVAVVVDGVEHIVRFGSSDSVKTEYTLRLSSRVLRAILEGRTGWEEALLSLRLSLERDPDVFDSIFMSLLRYGNHPTQTRQIVRERDSDETIDLDGYRMQRFCPHAGEDLAFATLRDGVLECPRHHWKWDVQTGECIDGGSIRLRITAIDPAERDLARDRD